MPDREMVNHPMAILPTAVDFHVQGNCLILTAQTSLPSFVSGNFDTGPYFILWSILLRNCTNNYWCCPYCSCVSPLHSWWIFMKLRMNNMPLDAAQSLWLCNFLPPIIPTQWARKLLGYDINTALYRSVCLVWYCFLAIYLLPLVQLALWQYICL
jgi:hypothetical protein